LGALVDAGMPGTWQVASWGSGSAVGVIDLPSSLPAILDRRIDV
jgi:hypothetical protein